jgi:hypothetical protein
MKLFQVFLDGSWEGPIVTLPGWDETAKTFRRHSDLGGLEVARKSTLNRRVARDGAYYTAPTLAAAALRRAEHRSAWDARAESDERAKETHSPAERELIGSACYRALPAPPCP